MSSAVVLYATLAAVNAAAAWCFPAGGWHTVAVHLAWCCATLAALNHHPKCKGLDIDFNDLAEHWLSLGARSQERGDE